MCHCRLVPVLHTDGCDSMAEALAAVLDFPRQEPTCGNGGALANEQMSDLHGD